MGVVGIEDAHHASERRRHQHRFGDQPTRQQEPWRRVRDSVVKYEVWDATIQVRVSVTFNRRTGVLGISAHSQLGDFDKVYSPGMLLATRLQPRGSLDRHAVIALTLSEFATALLRCVESLVGSHGGME